MTRTHSLQPRLVALGAAGAMAMAGTVALAGPAGADPRGTTACAEASELSVAGLTECVTLDGVMEHLEAFQGIADDNEGIRASGTPGFDVSADYVQQRLEKVGWDVERQTFEFPFFRLDSSTFARTSEPATTFVEGTDYTVMTYSATGSVSGTVQAVDVQDPPSAEPNGSTSGCEAEDFSGFTPGNVALVQRGTCTFGQKAQNAADAGASAVIAFNEGQPDRVDLLQGTLGGPGTIPAIGVSHPTGLALSDATVQIDVQAISEFRDTENVVAELRGRTSDNVVMAGAHLDSVPEGPGINDNGSGSAALIEVAENLGQREELPNTVRFAWWGAEELGLLGSAHYVSGLDPAELEAIALYLNFDMVGSPNFARLVYDGDQSDFPAPQGVTVPEGSDQIEYVFEDFYEEQELFYEGTEFSGRSDYQAFINNGIPAGGLFTGAEVLKQEYQVTAYGGEAGVAYDPNYHQVGDDIANVDEEALDQNSDAVAYAVLTLAHSTERVNGVVGEPVPGGTFEGDPQARKYRLDPQQEAGGGGLHAGHDHGGDAV